MVPRCHDATTVGAFLNHPYIGIFDLMAPSPSWHPENANIKNCPSYLPPMDLNHVSRDVESVVTIIHTHGLTVS